MIDDGFLLEPLFFIKVKPFQLFQPFQKMARETRDDVQLLSVGLGRD